MMTITTEQGSGMARSKKVIPTYALWIVQGLLTFLFCSLVE